MVHIDLILLRVWNSCKSVLRCRRGFFLHSQFLNKVFYVSQSSIDGRDAVVSALCLLGDDLFAVMALALSLGALCSMVFYLSQYSLKWASRVGACRDSVWTFVMVRFNLRMLLCLHTTSLPILTFENKLLKPLKQELTGLPVAILVASSRALGICLLPLWQTRCTSDNSTAWTN